MLNMLAYNLNRGTNDVRLFEAGAIWEASGTKAAELKRVCMGLTGSAVVPSVNQPARPLSFFDVKGDVETLLGMFCSQGAALRREMRQSTIIPGGRRGR